MPEEEKPRSKEEYPPSSGVKKGGVRKSSLRHQLARCLEEKQSLQRALHEEGEKAKQYLTRLQYLQADFENYMKKMRREREDLIRRGNERIITKLLPVLDDLERAVEAGRKTRNNNPLKEGVEMVLKEVNEILRQEGLEKLNPIGKLFDSTWHEAVGQVITDEVPEGTVVKELRKGYLLNGRVIRTSMVEVAKKGGEETPPPNLKAVKDE